MGKKAKRAPGGGRKPQGDFDQLSSSPFSVRMPDYLRKQLEAAAKQSGRSVGQELLRRLNDSFARDYSKDRDRPTRAFSFLLGELIEKVQRAAPFHKWHSSPFLFRAVKAGFITVLKGLPEPEGDPSESPILAETEARINFYRGKPREKEEIKNAREMAAKWKTAERGGNKIAAEILSTLYRGNLPEIEQLSRMSGQVRALEQALHNEDLHKLHRAVVRATTRAERTHYGMQDAMRDLEITPEPKKSGG